MLDTITLITIGFSIVSAVILFSVYAFFLKNVNKTLLGFLPLSRASGGSTPSAAGRVYRNS